MHFHRQLCAAAPSGCHSHCIDFFPEFFSHKHDFQTSSFNNDVFFPETYSNCLCQRHAVSMQTMHGNLWTLCTWGTIFDYMIVNHVIKVFSKWALLKLNCQNPSYKLGAVLYKWWIQWTCWFQFSFELGSHEHYDYVHTMKCTPWKYHSHRDANNWAFQVCKMCH